MASQKLLYWDVKVPSWFAYKGGDGHPRDGFLGCFTRLAEIHPEGDHLPTYREIIWDAMSHMMLLMKI